MEIHRFFGKLAVQPRLQTEDLGKIFEMAICIAYGIPYAGVYRYSLATAEELASRLALLPTIFPACTHTAQRGARYDFTAANESGKHLSAKTSKRALGKVAPQVIGQCQPRVFCSLVGTEFVDIPTLKTYIQGTVTSILPVLVGHTFDCPNLYYNQDKGTIRYIEMSVPIDWTAYEYEWTCPVESWNNSSTLKVKTSTGSRALVEFQFHSASRSNMAVRWCYDTFLELFRDNLTIQSF